MTVSNVKSVAHSYKPAQNYHPTRTVLRHVYCKQTKDPDIFIRTKELKEELIFDLYIYLCIYHIYF